VRAACPHNWIAAALGIRGAQQRSTSARLQEAAQRTLERQCQRCS
jgi:hypothetical protein